MKSSYPGARKCKSKSYWIRYYLPSGKRRKVKGYTDRKATESYASELEKRAQRVDGGFADALDGHARKPLAEHAVDFRRYLAAKGNTALYVKLAMFRLTAVLDGCTLVRMADLQSHSRFYDLAAAVQALPIPVAGLAPEAEALAARARMDGRIFRAQTLAHKPRKGLSKWD